MWDFFHVFFPSFPKKHNFAFAMTSEWTACFVSNSAARNFKHRGVISQSSAMSRAALLGWNHENFLRFLEDVRYIDCYSVFYMGKFWVIPFLWFFAFKLIVIFDRFLQNWLCWHPSWHPYSPNNLEQNHLVAKSDLLFSGKNSYIKPPLFLMEYMYCILYILYICARPAVWMITTQNRHDSRKPDFIKLYGMIWVVPPPRMPVTTRITFLVRNPNLNLHFHYYWEGGQPKVWSSLAFHHRIRIRNLFITILWGSTP